MTNSRSDGAFWGGLVVGLLSGFFVCGVGAIAGFNAFKHRAQKGWNLVPVVVAAVDIEPGGIVTFDMISQRSIPEQFVTSSVVKPDSASYVVNQRVLVPLQAGDPLLWSQFEQKNKRAVLLAARDLPIGTRVSAEDLRTDLRPESELTASFAGEKDREAVLGHVVATPFLKNDPILLTHFKSP